MQHRPWLRFLLRGWLFVTLLVALAGPAAWAEERYTYSIGLEGYPPVEVQVPKSHYYLTPTDGPPGLDGGGSPADAAARLNGPPAPSGSRQAAVPAAEALPSGAPPACSGLFGCLVQGTKEDITTLFQIARRDLAAAWDQVKDGAGYLWDQVKAGARQVWDGVVWAAGKVWDGVKAAAGWVWNHPWVGVTVLAAAAIAAIVAALTVVSAPILLTLGVAVLTGMALSGIVSLLGGGDGLETGREMLIGGLVGLIGGAAGVAAAAAARGAMIAVQASPWAARVGPVGRLLTWIPRVSQWLVAGVDGLAGGSAAAAADSWLHRRKLTWKSILVGGVIGIVGAFPFLFAVRKWAPAWFPGRGGPVAAAEAGVARAAGAEAGVQAGRQQAGKVVPFPQRQRLAAGLAPEEQAALPKAAGAENAGGAVGLGRVDGSRPSFAAERTLGVSHGANQVDRSGRPPGFLDLREPPGTRAILLQKIIQKDGSLNVSKTVGLQLVGERKHIPVQAILETIKYGERVPDPQGVAGHFMYRIEAAYGGSRGTLEVLVDETSGQIRHVLYRAKKGGR